MKQSRYGRYLRSLLPVVALSVLLLGLSSCLSVEAEFDMRRSGYVDLTMRYRMNEALWDLGVFDENSPERAVPVSRRDAEETALRYEDVTLQDYRVHREGETVTVTVRYRAGSAGSLQGLWGVAGGGPLSLDERGRGISIPLAADPAELAPEQRELLGHIFSNQHVRITVLAPAAVVRGGLEGATGPIGEEREGQRYTLTLPMADLVTAARPVTLQVEWDQEETL